MSKANDITESAATAYNTKAESGWTANPYLQSSPNWYAHELGIYFHSTGRTTPRGVRMSRGASIRANDMLFKIIETFATVDGRKKIAGIRFERIN